MSCNNSMNFHIPFFTPPIFSFPKVYAEENTATAPQATLQQETLDSLYIENAVTSTTTPRVSVTVMLQEHVEEDEGELW